MSIATPRVLVYQDYTAAIAETIGPLRACIIGPNAILHRYATAAEKALIGVGAYDPLADANYLWPERLAGSKVDLASVRLFIDDALLQYFSDLIDSGSTIAPVAGRHNWIRSDSVEFKANGTEYPRSGSLYDRDVAIGDTVYLRGVADPLGDCDEVELWTTVAGFAADEVASSLGDARPASSNQGNIAATAATITQTGGARNCITASASATNYNCYAYGRITETYTIEVIRSSVSGCAAARLRVTSASGLDDVAEVVASDLGVATAIGTRGLTVTFDDTAGQCSVSASEADVAVAELVVGQTWEVVVEQQFAKACCSAAGTYTGEADDVYIIEVTKGGTWAELPQITVTTAKGLDSSGPTTITAEDLAFPIGAHGVTLTFTGCEGENSESAIAGLRLGDKFHVTVNTGADGPVRTIILRDDMPAAMRTCTDLDLKLYIKKDIEVTENRLSDPPNVNYEKETTQLVTKAGITAYDAAWTDSGVAMALPVLGGSLYIEYREFVATWASAIGAAQDTEDLADIPGQLDPDNPLKWGVYRAIANAEGTLVKYIAVADPDDLDSWNAAVALISGRTDVYNIVAMSYDVEVLNLVKTQVLADSSEETGAWKAMFGALLAKSTKMVVGQSAAAAQLLHPTSTDGAVVLATLEDNPDATGTQYTRLHVPANNAGFVTYGVQAGDIVRYLYTVDGFGAESYREFIVDEVLSESTLLLQSGHTAAIEVAQRIEVWHTLTKPEIVADLKQQAQAFASNRVCMVWPDYFGTAGTTQEGYYLCAALAGLVSGVAPHQPVTNVSISGVDDLSRSYGYFTEPQLDDLQDSGIWIVTEDADGTPYTRHALTTDTTDLNSQEEMVRRNVDSISYLMLARLKPYIGKTNATQVLLDRIEFVTGVAIDYLKTDTATALLGGQLIDGTIAELKIHPLAKDRIYMGLDLTVPAPTNVIACHLVI